MNLLKICRNPYISMMMAFTLLFISCNTDEINNKPKQSIQNNSNIVNSYLLKGTNDRLLTDEQVEQIGNLHNEYLNEMISNIDFNIVNDVDLSEYSKTLGVNVNCDLIDQDKQYIINTFTNKKLDDIKGNLSLSVYNYALEVKNKVYASNNHEQLINNLDLVENNARKSLQGSDLDQILVMISVAKKSSYFWKPTIIGGSGIGDNYNTTLSNTLGKRKPSSDDILMADCIAALEGMSLWALGTLLLSGPQSVVAYVVSIGLGAGYSSLKYYLTDYNP